MTDNLHPICPECDNPQEAAELLQRRHFLSVLGKQSAGAIALGSLASSQALADSKEKPAKKKIVKPAEELIRELYSTLSEDQKKTIVLPWNHGSKNGKGLPTRLGMFNRPIMNLTIEKNYDKKQQELVQRILKAISSDEEGYKCITRNGTFDGSRSFERCGALIFGDPSGKEKFSWVFSGHHLTVRCDGNSEEGAAFGGPMYYGHSPNGYSTRNVFNYQTKEVQKVFEALEEKQRKKAIVTKGSPGEQARSVRFRPEDEHPGIGIDQLSSDQKALIESVMRTILSPYRKEDAEEVMTIIKKNGGLDKINLAFYEDQRMRDNQPWHFWRLEGPGFVWNFRVLPHVHTYVNISSNFEVG